MAHTIFQKVVAVMGGMLAGLAVHLLSRAFGLQETTPGSVWAAAVAA